MGGTGPEVLSEAECLRLLAKAPVGRIVYTERAMPAIQPVDFVLDEKAVIIRTTAGSRLATAVRGAVVAFQADEFEPDGTGWSVVAVGNVSRLEDPGDLVALRRFAPLPWTVTEPEVYLKVSVEVISGRRITAGPVAGSR